MESSNEVHLFLLQNMKKPAGELYVVPISELALGVLALIASSHGQEVEACNVKTLMCSIV